MSGKHARRRVGFVGGALLALACQRPANRAPAPPTNVASSTAPSAMDASSPASSGMTPSIAPRPVSMDAGADAGNAVSSSRAREVRGGSPSCVSQPLDAKPRSLRGCVKPLSAFCDLAAVPVPTGEPLAMSRACPRFSDVLEETDHASERASIAECKNGRVVRVWGSFVASEHYFDACDRLVGVEKTFDTKAACNRTSFGISYGRTELEECIVTERFAKAWAVQSSEPEIVAAAAALGAVSLSACPAPSHDGAQAPATVHVTATFENDGRISAVRVDAPPRPLPTSCVESSVRLARIAPFSGSPISVGATYVLR